MPTDSIPQSREVLLEVLQDKDAVQVELDDYARAIARADQDYQTTRMRIEQDLDKALYDLLAKQNAAASRE